ncbi:MAG: ACT domain-containing protein [Clostridia bacterium]|nr:ACT domain-containing protein [Clostridia bacterium]
MSVNQISVFLENRKGQLAEITTLLADKGINLRAISIAETADYGLLRIIVDDADKASSALLSNGNIITMTPVVVVGVPDEPAGLAQLLSLLSDSDIDIQYMYSLFTHANGKAYMVFRVEDEMSFTAHLASHNIAFATKEELGLK